MKSGINFSTAYRFLLEKLRFFFYIAWRCIQGCQSVRTYVQTYMSRINNYNYFIRLEKFSKFSSSTKGELLWPTSCSEGGG